MVPVLRCISFAAYLDRLTMPKLLINSGGDEFFLPDDNHYFWNDLPGEKFLRYNVSWNFSECWYDYYIWTYDIEHASFFQYYLRDILPNLILIKIFHCTILSSSTLTLFN